MLSVIIGACGQACEPSKDDEPACFLGDPSAPLEIALVARTREGESVLLKDGDEVPLTVPPQGGHVLFIGVKARNVNMCTAQLSAAVHDECTASDGNDGRIIGREGRRVVLSPGPDGFAWPKDPEFIDNYGNIPACPNFASTRDIEDEPYLVRVRLTESDSDRTAIAELHLTPTCEPGDEDCRCSCDRDYVLGAACDADTLGDEGDPEPGACRVSDAQGGEGEGEGEGESDGGMP